jgi:hypothetical protein
MFEGALERKLLRVIVFVCVFICIAFTAFVNIIFGIKFSVEQKDAWLLSILTGLFADIVVLEPGTQLVKAIVSFVLMLRKKSVSEAIFVDNAISTSLSTLSPSVYVKANL